MFFLAVAFVIILLLYIASKNNLKCKKYLTISVFVLYTTYIILRVFSIPITYGFTSGFLGMALFISELIGFFAFAVYIYIFYSPKKEQIVTIDISNPNLPSVDVLICTYNEPVELVTATVIGAIDLEYPKDKLNVYILDDGHREEFKALAQELNVNYITRSSNKYAKAGNINNALKYINSDLFLVLDADMIPKKEFLKQTVGKFNNPKMAFVQTPQTFYNKDIYQYNLKGKYYSEQDFFMRCIEPARNSKNAVLHIGTNTLFRKQYVDEVGGYPTTSITEDMALGLKLQAKGYDSCFINKTLVYGLCPFNLKDTVKQRDRWCRGNLQVIKDFKKEFKKKLKLKQKIIYVDGVVYWFTGVTKLIFLVTPVIHILTGIPIINYDKLYLIPVFFALFFGQIMLSKRILPEKISKNYLEFFYNGNIYNTVMAPHLTFSICRHYMFPDIKFSVTNKKIEKDKRSIDIKDTWFAILLLILYIFSLYVATKNVLSGKLYLETFYINVFWLVYNLPSLIVAVKLGFQKPRGYDYIDIETNEKINVQANSQNYTVKLTGRSFNAIRIEIPKVIDSKLKNGMHVTTSISNIQMEGILQNTNKKREYEIIFKKDITTEEKLAINRNFIEELKPYKDNYKHNS